MRLDELGSSYRLRTRNEFKMTKKMVIFAKWDITEASRWRTKGNHCSIGASHSTTMYPEHRREAFDFIQCFVSKYEVNKIPRK